jgi:predicted nuclease with TOPRIM domain
MSSTSLIIPSQTVRTRSRQCELNHQRRRVILLEQSLGQLDAVQAQLAQDEQDLREEIAQLQDELRLQQGHGRIQLIQEMISVCPDALILCTTLMNHYLCVGPFGSDVSHPGEGYRV